MSDAFQARVDRDLVVVDGPDATSFLQSLVSQDLDAVPVGAAAHTLLLQPQGKLLVEFYALHAAPDEWWCVCEGGFGEPLAAGLSRFKIRVKADIRAVPVAALAVRGIAAADLAELSGVRVIPVDWNGAAAVDLVGADDAIRAAGERVAAPVVDAVAYERARVEAGVPRQGFDVDERTIPQEAGLERTAVSFTKGCFVGQELVCRIDTRGHVNRNLRRVRVVDEAGVITPDAPVLTETGEVGTVTTAAGPVGLAMLRREVEAGAQVRVGAATAVVEAI